MIDTLLPVTLNSLADLPCKIDSGAIPADSIDVTTIESARGFIIKFFELVVIGGGNDWVMPHVSTEGCGEVTFEWWHKGRSLSLFVNPDGKTEYLKAWGPHIWNEMEEGDLMLDKTAVMKLWQWLKGG